jgi:hypothetical protein
VIIVHGNIVKIEQIIKSKNITLPAHTHDDVKGRTDVMSASASDTHTQLTHTYISTQLVQARPSSPPLLSLSLADSYTVYNDRSIDTNHPPSLPLPLEEIQAPDVRKSSSASATATVVPMTLISSDHDHDSDIQAQGQ